MVVIINGIVHLVDPWLPKHNLIGDDDEVPSSYSWSSLVEDSLEKEILILMKKKYSR